MSYTCIWIHAVWSTKCRYPFLTDAIRNRVIFHILENARNNDIYIDHVNGYLDHLNALISLGKTQNICEVMQLIKGESSFWINNKGLCQLKFAWQREFYAVSLGISELNTTRKYIRNQFEHHRKVEFEAELNKMAEEYHLEKINKWMLLKHNHSLV